MLAPPPPANEAHQAHHLENGRSCFRFLGRDSGEGFGSVLVGKLMRTDQNRPQKADPGTGSMIPVVLKCCFLFLSLAPPPPGVPGEAPDCHYPQEIGEFFGDPGPGPGGNG